MFCPKCATQNLEGASFCRVCGANISLVPQALTGQLPQAAPDYTGREGRRARRRGKELTLDQSFKNIFMGIAFLIVAIALSRSIGRGWWFWMLFPAFSMMGTGIAQYIRIKDREKQNLVSASPVTSALPNRSSVAPLRDLPSRNTGELRVPIPSVTEGTTRHLGAEGPTRHFDSEQE
jgi:zinc-ribbon domain